MIAIHTYGIPSLELMETASRSVADYIRENFPGRKVLVVSSTGNNGADGICVARYLFENGYDVSVNILGDLQKASWEFLYQLSAYKKQNGSILYNETDTIIEHDVLTDGLFGIGLTRDIEGEMKEYIRKLNEYPSVKIAIDVPSGLSASDGEVKGICLKADVTITFGRNKIGLINRETYTGKVLVKDIGIPNEIYEKLSAEGEE